MIPKVVPTSVIEAEIAKLLRVRAAVAEQGGTAAALRMIDTIDTKVSALRGLITTAERSADDRLDAAAAVAWSGLSRDALVRNYPSEGSHRTRTWRRGDLPCRDPYGPANPAPHDLHPASDIAEDQAADDKVQSEQELINRAVADAIAA